MSISQEQIILAALCRDKSFTTLAAPFLKSDYFTEVADNTVYEAINAYIATYDALPSEAALLYEVTKGEIPPDKKTELEGYVTDLYKMDLPTAEWLKDHAEKFCREKAAYNAIMTSIAIYNGDEKKLKPEIIPDMLRDAVNITFDVSIGHDWFEDAAARYEYYTNPIARVPFQLDVFNRITGGGVPRKTLNIVAAGINAGKTGFMCNLAAGYVKAGYNVLYITLEMAEEEISRRIDANLLNIPMDRLPKIGKTEFLNQIDYIKQKGYGKLILKQYEAGIGHSGHFRHIIRELKAKRGLDIDVMFVDYLGICASALISHGKSNSYEYQKFIAQELRNIGITYDMVVWTGVQFNRQGARSTDNSMEDVADSHGVPATADFMVALTRTDELDEMNQVMCKQIKSRYGDKSELLRFVLGVNQARQQYYDVENPALSKLKATESRRVEADASSIPTGGTAARFANLL